VPDLLVVFDDVAQVVASAVVGFAHAHAVVREVDVAVVAEELRHCGGVAEDVRLAASERRV
jgi:hypothetical protein